MGSCLDHFYPLTSLQIRKTFGLELGIVASSLGPISMCLDTKANLSLGFLSFAPDTDKFLILVDNRSWRKSKHSISTLMKEFVMTSYRSSIVINSKPLLRSSSFCLSSTIHETKTENLFGWFPILNMVKWREKTRFIEEHLHKALHGFIVFEVSWKDVRGIKYLNELQKDAFLALEVKSLTKWEFDSINEALSCVTSWFSSTLSETQTLRNNLIHLQEQVLSPSTQKITPNCPLLNDASQDDELFSEDEFFDANEASFDENDSIYTDHQLEEEQNVKADNHNIGPKVYKDNLLLFTCNDKDLPSALTQIITPNLKLLTLLESNLPSWVIFLQSYPPFSALYRPWMRPLYRTLYILVSLVTVIIGFYDLYKNMPLLKATVSHLCGPFFKWIESWDMISRIKCLGTMLFLQNLGKAVKAFLSITRAIKLLVSLITKPLMYPVEKMANCLMPLWSLFTVAAEEFHNIRSAMLEFFCGAVSILFDVFILPLKVLYSHLLNLASLVYPILSSLWKLFLFSIQGCLLWANYVRAFFNAIYKVLEMCFRFAVINMIHLQTYFRRLNRDSSQQFSFWHSLWKDLFSKVFHSVNSIIRVLSTFIASRKRFRLSINNHLRSKPRQSPKDNAKECEDYK